MITQEQLKELLNYNPETGVFTWVSARGNLKAGSEAGTVDYQGYIRISINNKRYRAHRLAWIYVYGEISVSEIDHINGNKQDNRILNLRLATRSQNEANKPRTRVNLSGYKGVSHTRNNHWSAQIMVNKRFIHLGIYSTAEEASAAYRIAAYEYFGEFAK
jgi:hypothetical protein